jgi:hypothetical protein
LDEEAEKLEVASGVATDGRPFVHLIWGDVQRQWTVDEARQFGRQCLEVAEAAEHDALVFAWLGDRLGISEWEKRAEIIHDLRQYRQDSTTSTVTAPPEHRPRGWGGPDQ